MIMNLNKFLYKLTDLKEKPADFATKKAPAYCVMNADLQCIISADWGNVNIFGVLMSFFVINVIKSTKEKFKRMLKKFNKIKSN